jgi:hypothetical protein
MACVNGCNNQSRQAEGINDEFRALTLALCCFLALLIQYKDPVTILNLVVRGLTKYGVRLPRGSFRASERKWAVFLAPDEAATALVADVVPLGASIFGPCLVYLATRCRRLSRRLEEEDAVE